MAIVNQPKAAPQPHRREPEGPKGPTALTLKEAIFGVVDKAADRLLWREFGKAGRRGVDRAILRNEIWGSAEGKQLTDLSRDRRYAGLEVSKAKAAIAKNPAAQAYYAPALALLDKGRFTGEGPA
jgi:hypothetical protein